MADTQLNPLGSVTAPASWTLPASLNLQPKNVYASYNGTSAAGSFVPCLQIISDSGHTVGSYPCATTVAAGASADVTWFPRVSAPQTAAPGATAYLEGVFAAQTIPSGGGGGIVRWNHFRTNDTTVFGTNATAQGAPPWNNTAGDRVLTSASVGAFSSSGMAQLAAGVYAQSAIVDNIGSQWQLDTTGGPLLVNENEATNTDAFGTAGNQAPSGHRMFYTDATTLYFGVRLLVTQTSGSPQALVGVSLGVIYGDGGTGALTQIY